MTAVPAAADALWGALRCPQCQGELERRDADVRCGACGAGFPLNGDQPDLRLRTARTVEFPVRLEPIDEVAARRRRPRPLPLNPDGLQVDLGEFPEHLANGNGLTPELVSWFPQGSEGTTMLDMGCGDRRCEPVLRLTGHEYVGMDIGGEEPDVLGIGEALPFADETFDFVFTLAVIPHTTHPAITMREIQRVLKPGGRCVGTAQFLEPCHMQSRHHASALGVQDWLDVAGLDLVGIESNDSWLGTDSMLCLGLSPRLGWKANLRIGRVVRRAYRAQVRSRWEDHPTALPGEGARDRLTGGFRFVADKPLS